MLVHGPGFLCTSEGHLALFFFPCQTRKQRTFVAATRSDKVAFVIHSYCRFCIHELVQSGYVVNMVNFVCYKYTCIVVVITIIITIIILLLSSLSYHHHHHHHWSADQRCFISLPSSCPPFSQVHGPGTYKGSRFIFPEKGILFQTAKSRGEKFQCFCYINWL